MKALTDLLKRNRFAITSYDANEDEYKILHSKNLTPAARDEVYRVLMERKKDTPGAGSNAGTKNLMELLKRGKKKQGEGTFGETGAFAKK